MTWVQKFWNGYQPPIQFNTDTLTEQGKQMNIGLNKGFGTQNERLLRALLTGQKITPLDSWRTLGIYRLASRINDLRQGYLNNTRYPIITETVTVKNQYGDEARVAQYRMDLDKLENRDGK